MLLPSLLTLALALAGCGDDGVDPNGDDAGDKIPPSGDEHTLSFKVVFGEEEAECGKLYEGFGPDGDQRAGLEELRFYIHGIELVTADGARVRATIVDDAPWQDSGVAYLHFANPSDGCLSGDALRDEVRIITPEGDYEGLVFRLGVPAELNHLDPSLASSPLNIGPMSWGWMMGYLYFRAELSVEVEGDEHDDHGDEGDPEDHDDHDHGSTDNFAIHVGSMACEGTLVPEPDITCDYPNRGTIELPNFKLGSDTILIDLAALVGATDLRPEGEAHHGSAGCMAEIDPEDEGYIECVEPMTSLGIDYGMHPASMDAFRVAN